MEQFQNVALIGFMGAGKSSIGRRVAQKIGSLFVDGDGAIEAQAGKSPATIFEEDGEPAFRQLEREVTTKLSKGRRLVIATGGGAFLDVKIRESLLKHCFVIFLDAPFEVLWERIAGDPKRPLLAGEGAKERTRTLFEQRRPVYSKAHATVLAALPMEDVVNEIVASVAARWQGEVSPDTGTK